MTQCWAECLGDCEGGISGEHIVTAALWRDNTELGVKGFRWCKDAYKFISVKSHTSNILCRKHNSNLSTIDDAAIEAFESFRKIEAVHRERMDLIRFGQWAGRFDMYEYHINGPLLERWFLKTLVNHEIAGRQGFPIGPISTTPNRPSPDLVEMAFGKRKFEGKAGLYYACAENQLTVPAERIAYRSLLRDDTSRTYVGAAAFLFFGFRFWLCLGPDGWPELLDTKAGRIALLHHCNAIDLAVHQRPSQRAKFEWTE